MRNFISLEVHLMCNITKKGIMCASFTFLIICYAFSREEKRSLKNISYCYQWKYLLAVLYTIVLVVQ